MPFAPSDQANPPVGAVSLYFTPWYDLIMAYFPEVIAARTVIQLSVYATFLLWIFAISMINNQAKEYGGAVPSMPWSRCSLSLTAGIGGRSQGDQSGGKRDCE